MKKLRICIDARLKSGTAGGVEQFITGLAYGLSQLTDGSEDFLFLAYSDEDSWILPYMKGNCKILHCTRSPKASSFRKKIIALFPVLKIFMPFSGRWSFMALFSDRPIKYENVDLVHFTHQIAFRTKVPTIYHPHDLQHRIFPSYFNPLKIVARDLLYRYFCYRSKMIAVASTWTKNHLVESYRISSEKVRVVPLAPPTEAYAFSGDQDNYDSKINQSLPGSYLFYPAQILPHKNHVNLIKAVHTLKVTHNVEIPVVFSGSTNTPHYDYVKLLVKELQMEGQVTFLGFVSPTDLKIVYQSAKCVVIPTLFEAGSFPIWESFLARVPVACSNVTSLPAQVGNSAIIFDPHDIEQIANATYRLWTSKETRDALVASALENVNRYSWIRTAEIFRAYYRKICNLELNSRDLEIISATPMM